MYTNVLYLYTATTCNSAGNRAGERRERGKVGKGKARHITEEIPRADRGRFGASAGRNGEKDRRYREENRIQPE